MRGHAGISLNFVEKLMVKWNPELDLPSLRDVENAPVMILYSRTRRDRDLGIEINEE